MEPVSTIGAIMATIKNFVDMVDRKGNKKIKFGLSVRWFAIDQQEKTHLLILVSIVNKSEKPYSIGHLDLILNDAQYEPVYIEAVEKFSVEYVKVLGMQSFHLFKLDGLEILREFPQDAYLRPGESMTGLLMYRLNAATHTIHNAAARLYIAGYDYHLQHDFISS